MLKKMLIAGAAACFFSTGAFAANAPCPNISNAQLKTALKNAIVQTGPNGLGLGLNMWATVVAADGVVCAVANSSGDPIQGQWLASRVISAQKAFTAATLSLGPTANSGSGLPLATGKLALSSANLYSAVNPGGSLYGLQHSNPVAAAGAYGDKISPGGVYAGPIDTATYGTASDPMIGQVIGGINVFGGGLGLYAQGGVKVGGVGVSGDTSCEDHLVAWRLRRNLNLDYLATIGGVSGDAARPDNIVFDITPNPNGGTGVSAGGFGHPTCLAFTQAQSKNRAKALPAVR
ncbi:heme-binding protein [Methylocystis sp. WRRC1]|uniref:heme-binding protein n=1 Tax=Methylocystis sp. WRRC1 TaxID=1732014 RepID=UPI001D14D6B5|nr:heme-binding protein [Methylocystis sp. WRRC1]MCC3246401.1 heme-binding protein [Methylocystis sp. WRRC1]